MKKLIGMTFVGLFMISMTSKIDCVQLAIDVGDAYESAGYDYEYAYMAANWAYEGCISNNP